MKLILNSILFCLFGLKTYSQKPTPGYMISQLGDTAKGFIQFDYEYIKDGGYVFYDSLGNIANTKSKNWLGMGAYTKTGNHHFIKLVDDKGLGKKYLFIERVLQGKISIYKYFKPEYYYQIPYDSNLFGDKLYDYYLQKNNGEYILFQFNFLSSRKKTLKKLFEDCAVLYAKIEPRLNEEQTFKLISEYNNTCK